MKLGQSPIHLEEFIQIKEQINFISRLGKSPDWKLVKSNADKILTGNGVDLHTLVYVTVANYQLNNDFLQISQDIEKISIALISYWDELWPQNINARLSILNWLNRQVSESIKIQFANEESLKARFCLLNSLSHIIDTFEVYTNEPCNLANLLIELNQNFDERFLSHKPQHLSSSVNQLTPVIGEKENKIVTYKAEQPLPQEYPVKSKPFSSSGQSKNTEIRNSHFKPKLYLGLLLSFILGGMVTFFFFDNQIKKNEERQLTKIFQSPLYGLQYGTNIVSKSTGAHNVEDVAMWRNKLTEYTQLGSILVKPNQGKLHLDKLQQDLLDAEKSKKGITISHLKTEFYNLEKELVQNETLEQALYDYYKERNNLELKQKIDRLFLSLLAYYYTLQQGDSGNNKN